jgi:SAM-dependent methyltransferase
MLKDRRGATVHEMTVLKRLEASLPAEFNDEVYRGLHRDLQRMSSEQLRTHWERHGKREGRRSHPLADRHGFVQLIPEDADTLEIGPFYAPATTGPRTRYFDILDRAALVARAQSLGLPFERVPEIDFVSPAGELDIIDRKFDVVLSSHVLEHQPDLIAHLRAVERRLRPGGFYFLAVPDKNYCFDHFIARSSIAEIIDAHHAKRTIHTLKSQIEHAALRTHNDPKRHWSGDHGELVEIKERIMTALAEFRGHPDQYVDVHAWYFEPSSFRETLDLLRELEYTNFSVARIYPTLRDSIEFWAILKAPPA